ncbi:MAG: hypothetical protein ACFCVE_03455 [Phycisphaerae bacterium]
MGQTQVDVCGGDFLINGRPTLQGRTYQGHRLEGLLPNARLVQATFDDLNAETRGMWSLPHGTPWDAGRNLSSFLQNLPRYRAAGLLAFTINAEGGSPQGYSKHQPWHNSVFEANGRIRPAYAARVAAVLDAADALGMGVMLGIFYFGQTHRLCDAAAVLAAVDAITDLLLSRGDRHVLIEIANEQDCHAYDDSPLAGFAHGELIRRVQERSAGKVTNDAGRLLVSTSYLGGHMPEADTVEAADYILIHGNGVHASAGLGELIDRVRAMPEYVGQPVVVNEDDHFEFDKPENNFLAATAKHASWGYFDYCKPGEPWEAGFQSVPTDWRPDSHDRKRGFFKLLADMTGGRF